MRKKIVATIISVVILLPMFAVLPVAFADLEDDIEQSIEEGIAWLAGQQNADGSWGSGGYKEPKTSFALIKLQNYAWEHDISPFDPLYEYYDNVTKGWNYIFSTGSSPQAHAQNLSLQNHTSGATGTIDDPDANGNGIGVSVSLSSIEVYSTGIMLMALEASRDPTRSSGVDFDGNGTADSFFDVAQDTADWLAFVQGDSGNDEGGWGYDLHDNQILDHFWTDNSVSGYAMLGLAAAEGFGCSVPSWVRTELNVWIGTIQDPVNGDADDGGSYYNPDWLPWDPWVNELKAGNLIFEMTFYGDDPSVPRFEAALNYTVRHWQDLNIDPGWGYNQSPAGYQPMFCLMKGFEYSGIDLIDLDGDSVPEHDWYEEFATVIVDQQQPDGHWNATGHGDDLLSTIWALLTLEKIAPPPPFVTVSVDIKPGSWPNPINKGSKGVISVAICGTAEFDVMTIDPGTVMIYNETSETGVASLRWSYEDAATPYNDTTPDGPDGHEMTADGFVDLVLKFDTQEVVGALGLCGHEDWEYVKLFLKGNLFEEESGTPIEGFDWVRIQSSKGKGKK
jgi:hypothetical protein